MPAFRSLSTVVATTNSLTGTDPTGAAADDILIGLLYRETATGNAVTPPSGWSNSFNGTTVDLYSTVGGQDFNIKPYWIRRGSSAPALTWGSATSVFSEILVAAYSGAVSSGDPWSFLASAIRDNTSATTFPDTSGTTLDANELLIWSGVNWVGGTTSTQPTGFTERLDLTGNDFTLADLVQASAGATGTVGSASWSGTAGAAVSLLFGLRPPAASSTVLRSVLGRYTPFTTNYAGRQ